MRNYYMPKYRVYADGAEIAGGEIEE